MKLILCSLLLMYLVAVKLLRWRRYHAIHKEFESKYKEGKLTAHDAQRIVAVSAFYDMPFVLGLSITMALFKTYGIPSISTILGRTQKLRSKEPASKRYADTGLLIATWFSCPLSGLGSVFDPETKSGDVVDRRASVALARVNWLHSRYRIPNEDFLYTLSLFVLEPIAWAQRYGWRALSPMEQQAYYLFWAEIGKRLNIKDIPASLDAMREYSQEFEDKHMVPAETSISLASYAVEESVHVLTDTFGIKDFVKRMSVCLLDDRVRTALMFPEQPWYLHSLTRGFFGTISSIHYHLSLPRTQPKRIVDTGNHGKGGAGAMSGCPGMQSLEKGEITQCPRMHPAQFQVRPWYRAESSGLDRIKDRIAVFLGIQSEMPGPHLKSEGYRLEELGPSYLEHLGHEEVLRMAQDL